MILNFTKAKKKRDRATAKRVNQECREIIQDAHIDEIKLTLNNMTNFYKDLYKEEK